MKILKTILANIFVITFLSCEKPKADNYIIQDDMILEFRTFGRNENHILKLFEKGSEEFDKLKSLINNIKDFKENDYSTIYPNYVILGKDLKILIDVRKIKIEYRDYDNTIKKLSKDISSDEFLKFRFLIQSNNWITDYGNIYGSGKFKTDKYTFCGLVPHEEEYRYKVGNWKFWNIDRELIAEGEFEIDSALALGRGGCEYMVKVSKVKNGKWKFFDENEKETKGTIEQIFKIENAE